MNLWHDLEAGENIPHLLNAVIEIPKDSKVKYELDKKTGLISVNRILHSSMNYPLNYGFVPRTYCDDKDPLDILVVCQSEIFPGSVMKVRPISGLHMIDDGEIDDKVIAVHVDDPRTAYIKEKEDLGDYFFSEVKHFFQQYKHLENKKVVIEKIYSKEETLKIIEESVSFYEKNRSKLTAAS